STCGGWLGEALGGTLRNWVGQTAAYILLTAVALLAVLLIVDRPLPELLGYAGKAASGTAAKVKAARGLRVSARQRERSPFLELEPETEATPAGTKANGKMPAKTHQAALETPLSETLETVPDPLPPTVTWRAPEPPVSSDDAASRAQTKSPPKAKEAATESVPAAATPAAPAPASQDLKDYAPPPATLLEYAQVLPEGPGATTDTARNIRILEETLAEFKIQAKVVEIAKGPAFTRYEIRLAPGVRVNRIESLGDNIAMNLAALDVRIQAPIPGKSAIGIEVPNKATSMVSLREVIESPEFQEAPSRLTFALGKDVTGRAWTADLAHMPHLLIGGATNSGKSVCLNCMIASILFRARPDEVKFLLIDPKRVELSLFDGIPHLLYPVVTDVKKAAGMLNWAVEEMERRYDLFVKVGSRDIVSYNQRVARGEEIEHLPYIVVVVDELADLMMQVAADVERAICRLAQLGRAAGVHLVIATQRPSVDVITGLIKANISSRIAFAVSSHIDSRTILDKRGAERLLGRGDMLFEPIGASKPVRIQGAYISEKEVETLVEYLRRQATPVYTAQPVESISGGGAGGGAALDTSEDELFEDAVRYVVTTRRASTSTLQRKFAIGYTRAARLIDMMEERGIVSALDGSKPREVLVSREQVEQFFASPLFEPAPSPTPDEENGEEAES
ncbi:MAG: DNA translocase FtsK, partial [Armatimonadota bacterium]|nr:DNA translocase FtsK [Armatimonadota bacterium]